jgi:hypothetical protein
VDVNNAILDGFTITAGYANASGFFYPRSKTSYAFGDSSEPGFEALKIVKKLQKNINICRLRNGLYTDTSDSVADFWVVSRLK